MNARIVPFKKRIKSRLGRVLFATGLHRRFVRNKAFVVTFHRVNSVTPNDTLSCSVELFKKFCTFFARYFAVVPLPYVIEKLGTGQPLSGELAITFDDGYRDNFERAAPLLEMNALPATFFVTTQFIGTDTVAWWDGNLPEPHGWMTWDQVRGLAARGFEIGAHTRTHADLGRIRGKKAWWEIEGSRRDIEGQLGRPVSLFAYPYGRANQMTSENRDLVKRVGFRSCCSCHGGSNTTGTDPFDLRRVPVSSWHISPYQFGYDMVVGRWPSWLIGESSTAAHP